MTDEHKLVPMPINKKAQLAYHKKFGFIPESWVIVENNGKRLYFMVVKDTGYFVTVKTQHGNITEITRDDIVEIY